MDQGFTVWVAADGHEAIRLHHAHAYGIVLALLDMCLPGLDAPETLTALRQEAPSLPCCFMTANQDARQTTQLLALGATHVFEKPLLLHEATAVIWGLIKDGKQ